MRLRPPDLDVADHAGHRRALRQRRDRGRALLAGRLLLPGRLLVVVRRSRRTRRSARRPRPARGTPSSCAAPQPSELLGLVRRRFRVVPVPWHTSPFAPETTEAADAIRGLRVPTRRCVAPCATAASRSPLMPAEIQSASGWSARRRPPPPAAGRTPRGVGAERRHGHHPAQVQVRAPGHRVGQRARTSVGPHPAAARGSSSRLTWTSSLSRRPAARGSAVERRHELGPVDRVHDVGVARHRAGLVALQPAR